MNPPSSIQTTESPKKTISLSVIQKEKDFNIAKWEAAKSFSSLFGTDFLALYNGETCTATAPAPETLSFFFKHFPFDEEFRALSHCEFTIEVFDKANFLLWINKTPYFAFLQAGITPALSALPYEILHLNLGYYYEPDANSLSRFTKLRSFSVYAPSPFPVPLRFESDSLRFLRLYPGGDSEEGPKFFSQLAKIPTLETLILRSLSFCFDFAPLLALPKLTHFQFYGKKIGDLSPLSELTQLTTLKLHARNLLQKESFPQLSGLRKLKTLHLLDHILGPFGFPMSESWSVMRLSGFPLDDLHFFPGLPSVSLLKDLSVFSEMLDLEELWLGMSKKCTDLSPLAPLTKIKSLGMVQWDGITDFSPLSNLRNLEKLVVESFADHLEFDWVSEPSKIKELSINYFEAESKMEEEKKNSCFSKLRIFSNLKKISLNYSFMDDWDFLAFFPKLESLECGWGIRYSDKTMPVCPSIVEITQCDFEKEHEFSNCLPGLKSPREAHFLDDPLMLLSYAIERKNREDIEECFLKAARALATQYTSKLAARMVDALPFLNWGSG